MQVYQLLSNFINKLKPTTMAKTKTQIEKFEAKQTINFKEVDAEFGRLESFIEDSTDFEPHVKEELVKLVQSNKANTGEKRPHLTNLAFLNTAIAWVNKYIDTLNK